MWREYDCCMKYLDNSYSLQFQCIVFCFIIINRTFLWIEIATSLGLELKHNKNLDYDFVFIKGKERIG